jgi:hypothetical protein
MSRYIKENELEISIERHKAGKCRVIPIFIRRCILDSFPQIKKLQGLPRDMSFISDMGEERWSHYTEIVQKINDVAHEMETERNISNSIVNNNDAVKTNIAKNIELLRNNGKIFLSTPESEEGKRKRKEFLYQVAGKMKYENWPYEIVPGIDEIEKISHKNEKERLDFFHSLISESLYSIHIIACEDELDKGIDKIQYELAKKYITASIFHRNIIWLLNADIKAKLSKEMTEEISMYPIATGNDYENIFEIIKSLDVEKEKKINELKKSFSPDKKVFMFYDFTKDHESDLRIGLKTKIEENKHFSLRFNLPNENLQKEKEDLEKCEGALIFYGAADPQWFLMRQSILFDAVKIQTKAVCIDEPEIDKKMNRDVSKNEFLTIKGKNELELGVKSFLDRLENRI